MGGVLPAIRLILPLAFCNYVKSGTNLPRESSKVEGQGFRKTSLFFQRNGIKALSLSEVDIWRGWGLDGGVSPFGVAGLGAKTGGVAVRQSGSVAKPGSGGEVV